MVATERLKTMKERIYEEVDGKINKDFTYIMHVLKTDENLRTFIDTVCISTGISLIILNDVDESKNLAGTDPLTENYHDTLSNEKNIFPIY